MARIFDIVEFVDEAGTEMVHRIPERGSGDFRIGSQVIVRESQAAVFFRDGRALDIFGPGSAAGPFSGRASSPARRTRRARRRQHLEPRRGRQ